MNKLQKLNKLCAKLIEEYMPLGLVIFILIAGIAGLLILLSMAKSIFKLTN
jgi:hypothetical protein